MIIIPARMASSRFPGKVLADIDGLPMVVATAKRVEAVDAVAVATDSPEVADVVRSYGFEAVMTSGEHRSGTDRISEAAQKLDVGDDEIIVNVQADEPFIEPEVVGKIYRRVEEAVAKDQRDVMMVSCYRRIDPSFASDPNLVKVVLDHEGYALYFSRSKIPYNREAHHDYYGHLGLYGFTKRSLERFCTLGTSPLEDIEKLEQLRALYFGYKIAMVEVESKSFGIDTTEDLERALKIFS